MDSVKKNSEILVDYKDKRGKIEIFVGSDFPKLLGEVLIG